MRDETIASFLTRLAARTAAPGGGATGALHAAQAAALLAMVARFSDGPRSDADVVGRVRAAADGLADEALELAEADSAAFEKVIAAYDLPKGTDEEKAARSAAIAETLGGAARPQADLMAAAMRLAWPRTCCPPRTGTSSRTWRPPPRRSAPPRSPRR